MGVHFFRTWPFLRYKTYPAFYPGKYFFHTEGHISVQFSILSYHVFAGIILLPINLISAFAPDKISVFFIYLSLFFLFIVVLLKIIRGLIISLDFWNNNFFQFFIYLCTFEILPVLILVKFLLYQFNL
ncbi:MAG: DUF4271 domain-containing protein [Saprospiraceae bacterium]|nr:DUF4271 domain-containing protein [Saprospiraceae bacterium]